MPSNEAAYDRLAADYHWLYDDKSVRLGTTTPGVRGALAGLPRGARVLDAACGIGLDTIAMQRRGFDVVGSDGSAAMLEVASARMAAAQCDAELLHSTWEALPQHVAPGSFGAVLCSGNSISHIRSHTEMVDVFNAFSQVLSPRGVVILDSHNWDSMEREGDRTVVDPIVVERDGARCARRYDWERLNVEGHPWRLRIELEISSGVGHEVRHHDVVLYPFSVRELHDRLRRAGFVQISIDVDPDEDRYTAVARRNGGG